MKLEAPAKLNLCLYLGPVRDDGLHELRSVFEPLELRDELTVTEIDGPADEVVCPGVEGPNLVRAALEGLRQLGWDSPPLRVEIEKRIPVAAGLGGGSADAAAVLRLARGQVEGIRELAISLGADVPSQLEPRPSLVAGAGEVVEPVEPPGEHALVLIPQHEGLATADVYREADRLGAQRTRAELDVIRRRLHDALATGGSPLDYTEHLVNDLQPAALALRPEVADGLRALEEAGAGHAMLTGSGPTAFGLFPTQGRAAEALMELRGDYPDAVATRPLEEPA
jgi:4-diphosphocytidyl-2-C-methyl-D-erythritol kinase